MIFFTTLYPIHSKKVYEEALDKKTLQGNVIIWPSEQYNALLRLREHVNNMSSSIHQLKAVSTTVPAALIELEKALDEAVSAIVRDGQEGAPGYPLPDLQGNKIKNCLALLNTSLKASRGDAFSSGANIVTNSIVALSGAGLFGYSCLMMANCPIGLALLGLGLAILSTVLLIAAVHSIYFDVRFLAGKQVKEITTLVNQLTSQPAVPVRQRAEGEEAQQRAEGEEMVPAY